MDVDAQSRRLQHRAQGLSIALISRETVLLSRLLYRNKSQHRREIAYQKSVRVAKEVSRYQSSELQISLKSVVKTLTSDNMKPSRCGKQRRQVAADGSRKMLQCGSVVVKMIEVIESTFSTVSKTLYVGHFISYYLTVAASMSRLWFSLCYHLLVIAECYGMIRSLYNLNELPPSMGNHLGEKYSRYLDGSLTRKVSAGADATSDGSALLSGTTQSESCTKPSDSQLRELNEDLLAKRKRDFAQVPVVTHERHHHHSVAVAVESDALEVTSQNFVRRTVPDRIKRLPNSLMIVTRTSTGRVYKVMVRSRQFISQACNRKVMSASLVYKDIELKRRRPSPRKQCGNVKLYAVCSLPSRALYRRRMQLRIVRKYKSRQSVRELQMGPSANMETAASDGSPTETTETGTKLTSGCDDIDNIFSSIV